MAEISIAYCSSHAPMMAAAADSAPKEQRESFFGALEAIRADARRADVQACVVMSNEHFTNFFLENFPQICIGLGEHNWGPTEAWLPIAKPWIPAIQASLGTSPAASLAPVSTRLSPSNSSLTTA